MRERDSDTELTAAAQPKPGAGEPPSEPPPSAKAEPGTAAGPANGGGATNGAGLSLLDGASPQTESPAKLFAKQVAVASDPTQALEARLEAYEDIIDSEVGDTYFARARNLEREFGFRQLYLKFEGGNPTGTQKDRIAFAQVRDALRRRYDTITLATCGNYGAAVATAAGLAGLRCVAYIPEGYHTRRLQEMTSNGCEIQFVKGDYEDAVMLSRERAAIDEYYDANPGGVNGDLQIEAYGQISSELYDDLRDAPAAVACPVSNGSTLAGIYRGFLSLYRRGKTSRFPLMVAGSSFGKNPIVQSWLKQSPRCEDLDPKRVKETPVNEPLINWHASDGDAALQAVRRTSGWAAYVSDEEMLTFARMLREKEGISVLPASTAGLIALIERHKEEPLPGDRYVVILTGRKS